MFAIDTNLLVYAHNMASEFHEHAASIPSLAILEKSPSIPLYKRGKQSECLELSRCY